MSNVVSIKQVTEEEKRSILDSNYIKHVEPPCDGACGVDEPHRHGFGCFKKCDKCGARCHPSCPAFKEKPNGARSS